MAPASVLPTTGGTPPPFHGLVPPLPAVRTGHCCPQIQPPRGTDKSVRALFMRGHRGSDSWPRRRSSDIRPTPTPNVESGCPAS